MKFPLSILLMTIVTAVVIGNFVGTNFSLTNQQNMLEKQDRQYKVFFDRFDSFLNESSDLFKLQKSAKDDRNTIMDNQEKIIDLLVNNQTTN